MNKTTIATAAAQATGAPSDTPEGDPLARLADSVESETAQDILDAMPPEPEPVGLPPEIVAGIAKIPLFLLRAVRSNIAKRLPEINDEWTDDVLQGPADAFPPIVMKYAARFAPVLGAYPEEAVLLLSTVPLFLGYMAATSKHESKALPVAERVDEKESKAFVDRAQGVSAAPAARPQGFVGVPADAVEV